MEKAVFIDRDGTLIKDKDYLADPEKVEWFPGVFEALKKLQAAGFSLVVVTNQSGVARGYFDEKTVQEVNNKFKQDLARENIKLTDLYYAPVHPQAEDEKYRQNLHLRKPAPGMLKKGAREHEIDLSNSYMVGDKLSDVQCGRRAKTKAILVQTGKNISVGPETEYKPDYVADNFPSAVEWIIDKEKR